MAADYIYYISIGTTVLTEHIFSSYDDAVEYAEENGIEDYHILEWDVN